MLLFVKFDSSEFEEKSKISPAFKFSDATAGHLVLKNITAK
jgi:hypothetical protein